MLHNLSAKHDFFFDGTICTWKAKPIDIELQPDTKLYHEKLYAVPRTHKDIFKK